VLSQQVCFWCCCCFGGVATAHRPKFRRGMAGVRKSTMENTRFRFHIFTRNYCYLGAISKDLSSTLTLVDESCQDVPSGCNGIRIGNLHQPGSMWKGRRCSPKFHLLVCLWLRGAKALSCHMSFLCTTSTERVETTKGRGPIC